MASAVEICNAALTKLGAPRITSLTQGTPNAQACNEAYNRLLEAELRKHRWSFAIERKELPASGTPPAFRFQNAFPLPSGWIRVLPPDPDENTVYNRVVENNQILTDEGAPLQVKLVMRVDDPNRMDPLFREALACAIAKDLCELITQSNTKKQTAIEDYKTAIAEAKKANAIEQPPQESPADSWLYMRL